MKFEMFMVGGAVRDRLLGISTKDVDFAVVADDLSGTATWTLGMLQQHLENEGYKIWQVSPEFLTIRGQFPPYLQEKYFTRDADFVLARKEGSYSDGRRPDWVKPGTLMDDLARRDFTINAIAQDSKGFIIDPFDGMLDIEDKILSFVGDPMERIREDALRVMRAFRFSITKGFEFDGPAEEALWTRESAALLSEISEERRASELDKMLRHDIQATITLLAYLPMYLRSAMFDGRVRLMTTLKDL